MTTMHAAVALGFAGALIGCSPTAPSQIPRVSQAPVTYAVSGTVTEDTPTGPAPVADVRIQAFGIETRTDAAGFYSMPQLRAFSTGTTI